jgi:hypothetical protein
MTALGIRPHRGFAEGAIEERVCRNRRLPAIRVRQVAQRDSLDLEVVQQGFRRDSR